MKETRTAVQTVRDLLDALWAYLRKYYADTILSWGSVWRHMRDAALQVWEPLRTAINDLWQGSLVPLGNYLLTEFIPGVVNKFSLALWPVINGVGTAAITGLGNAFVWLAGVIGQALDGVVLPALQTGLAVWTEPVSYTHLDVYKRQVLGRALRDPPGERAGTGGQRGPRFRQVQLYFPGNHSAIAAPP